MDRPHSPFQVRNVGTAQSVTVRVNGQDVSLQPGQTMLIPRMTVPGDVRVIRRVGVAIDLVAVGDTHEEEQPCYAGGLTPTRPRAAALAASQPTTEQPRQGEADDDPLQGFTPQQLYDRAASDAIRNTLFGATVLVATVSWAPNVLARVVIIVFGALAALDALQVLTVLATTRTVARAQATTRDRAFIVAATVARVGGSAVSLWLVHWAWRRVF